MYVKSNFLFQGKKKKSKFGIKLSWTKREEKRFKNTEHIKKVASEGYEGKSEMTWGPFSPGIQPKF